MHEKLERIRSSNNLEIDDIDLQFLVQIASFEPTFSNKINMSLLMPAVRSCGQHVLTRPTKDAAVCPFAPTGLTKWHVSNSDRCD